MTSRRLVMQERLVSDNELYDVCEVGESILQREGEGWMKMNDYLIWQQP